MSGQQIGAVVGGIVGAFFGMPQLGAAIGGMIGGWISPTQVNGPHIGDGPTQTSAEGQPIPWVIGTAGWIQPNIVDKSPRREVKKTDDGKGSGTEINTFEAHQDFVLMVCESSETRESLMVGVLMVRVDGKIVYDMREESNFGPDNAKFLKNHTFYNGSESQLPDPTAESFPHNGVGNTPYYRGVFAVVARDINLTQYGDRIPQYEFVMVGQGDSIQNITTSLVPPRYAAFRNDAWPLASPLSHYRYQVNWVDAALIGFTSPTFDSMEECADWFLANTGISAPTNYIGYSANSDGYAGAYTTGQNTIGNPITVSAYEVQDDVTELTALTLMYQFHPPVGYESYPPYLSCPSAVSDSWTGLPNGTIVKLFLGLSPDLIDFEDCGGGYYSAGYYPYCIKVIRRNRPPEPILGDPCIIGEPTLLPDSPGFTQDCNGEISPVPTFEEVSGDFYALQAEQVDTILTYTYFAKYTLGPILEASDPSGTQEFWESAYDAAVSRGEVEAGKSWPTDYPKLISTAYLRTVETNEISLDNVGVDTAITRIAKRGGLTADDIDVSEMTDTLLGYPIQQQYNGADCIRPLMTAFTSYGSEYDAKLRFHKHGEAIEVVIDPDDFIEGSDETDKDTREQAIEYPRLFSVTAIDPTQDYTARPQVERRISPDVRAIGEEGIQIPVVVPPDYQRQLAAIGMKVSWARAQGKREFSVPYATNQDTYLKLVAGKPFALDGKRRIAESYRLEDGEIHIVGAYDRQSAYTSDVTATPALPPTPPPSNIGGVTLFAALNAGVFRDQDDRVGLYVAVAGILESWPGCLLQWKLDTDSDWQTAIASMTQASTMGYLTAPLPLAPASGDDVTNTLRVSVHGGELNNITRQQYLMERNPYAIVTDEVTGLCELGQFQFANETAPGEYSLTTLVRGGLNTTPAAHAQGARFVFLDSVYFLEVPSAWIGRTIDLRPVTLGTSPDNNASYSILFDPAVSQAEWLPGWLEATDDGTTLTATVIPRHRLGNDLTPIASANFTGYRWTATDGSVTQTLDTVGPSIPITLADFTGPITISVSQINRITGPGPSMSIVIP